MSPEAAKRLRLLGSAVSLLAVLALVVAGWFYTRVRASLPQLAGNASAPGLGAAVTVDRDALGVPTIRAADRLDATRALGWLHAQERFFQMDLMRRSAAGELAELFGERAVPRDRAVRIHDFRRTAEASLAALGPARRPLLEAYAAGVNAGLAALGAKPFEYYVLRAEPQPWHPVDTILVAYAMALDLQDSEGGYERSLMAVRDHVGRDALAFFVPLVAPADAALDGSVAPLPPIPGPRLIDVRSRKIGYTPPPAPGRPELFFRAYDPETVLGSNALALAGTHTASGAALVAGDMHLDHGVPNTWYRASLVYAGRTVTGMTLPGTPAVIAGSNGRVAWGFTVANADVSDVVVVDINTISAALYPAPGHDRLLEIETRRETIRVKGGDPVTADYKRTIWGPIIEHKEGDRPLALRWTMHDPQATDVNLLDIEEAGTVADAVAVAHRAGVPVLNMIVGDSAGDVAWTVAGRLPKRVGFDGRLPVSWTFGDRRWDGYLSSAETPVIRGGESVLPGKLWSGNQRQVGGEALARLGDGHYARAARAAQLRDGLAPLARATPADLLAVQLDDRALLLAPWHALLMRTLTPEAVAGHKARAALRAAAETWEGRATPESRSYRLVREFRLAVFGRAWDPIFAPCRDAYPGFRLPVQQIDHAFRAILEAKPPHLLDARHLTWDDLLLAACDDTVAQLEKQGTTPARATWGERNRARIRHPFSYVFPGVSGWLDMPADPLPGGDDMPRIQTPRHGASERFAVSPGREAEGIFHMPGGQSGHPLSPHYRAGHAAWVRGEPTPFLPGATTHTLRLAP